MYVYAATKANGQGQCTNRSQIFYTNQVSNTSQWVWLWAIYETAYFRIAIIRVNSKGNMVTFVRRNKMDFF